MSFDPSLLTLDEANHRYAWKGMPVPGVSGVLRGCGILDETRYASEFGRLRGTAVHRAIALYEQGTLDDDSVHPKVRPYLDAWVNFKRDYAFVSLAQEVAVYDEVLGVAGTLDGFGKLAGLTHLLYDIKTGAVPDWVGIQTAGYDLLSKNHPKRPAKALRRCSIYFVGEEAKECRVGWLDERTDYDVFRSCASIENWKRRKKSA